MNKPLKVFCYTDIHTQQAMLDYPTKVRTSLVIANKLAQKEFKKADLALVGGDNVSDYPEWDKSCWLPKKNFLDYKKKLDDVISDGVKGRKVLYVAGNNDMILGDIGGEDWKPYNTTEFYYTGPMKDTLGELKEGEYYSVKSKEKPWEDPYLDAFHYVVGGIDFIGINIDPNTAYNTHEGYYTNETLDWVKKKLDEIDPDGIKPIFVVGHLSCQCYTDGKTWRESLINGDKDKFYQALDGHKNLFYMYGHIHGEGYVYKDFSSGAVLHIGEDYHTLDANLNRKDNKKQAPYKYTIVHMGGLRPFNKIYFEDDGIDGYGGGKEKTHFVHTGTPKLAQYMVVKIYKNKAVFYIRNTGSLEGYSIKDKPKPYTVYFKK